MFAKLLKHEWKSTAGLLGILSLAALGLSVLGAVILRILNNYGDQMSGKGYPLVPVALGTMLFFLAVALIAYAVGSRILLLARFYRNKFTDEGYLTFTLPVNCHQIFLSALLNMVAWSLITGAVTAAVVGIVALFGTATEGLVNTEVWSGLQEMLRWFFRLDQDLLKEAYWPITLTRAIVNLFSGHIIAMTCLTVGSVLAKKHKILASFGVYYGFTMVSGIFTTVLTFLGAISGIGAGSDAMVQSAQISYGIQILLQLALALGGYILSVWLMRKKLNLS